MRPVSFWPELTWWRCLAPISLLLLLGGCDPGFDYRPVDWPATSERLVWEKVFDGFSIKISHLSGLLGGLSITPEFEVTNLAALPLVLESAELRSGTRTFAGVLPGKGEAQWRTIEPGASRQIIVLWRLEKSVPQVLGKHPSVKLIFQVGDQRVPVEISYELHHVGALVRLRPEAGSLLATIPLASGKVEDGFKCAV
ncbi:MAG TPA: hypothetical protein VF173_32545 [Thermoanaerobaculia bacterium]|nr:hypothetical protein [Thermoanaerobaculia bacterium]